MTMQDRAGESRTRREQASTADTRLAQPVHRSSNGSLPKMTDWDWQRFWQKVRRGGPDACWPWMAAKGAGGYGRFKVDGKLYSAHRIAAMSVVGEFPPSAAHHGPVVMHRCDNPRSCNPKHLKITSQHQNVIDMMEKGRNTVLHDEAVASCRFGSDVIMEIRRSSESSREIANRLGVSHGHVRRIRRREARKYVA